jgi:phosphoribosylglycinamide formyltransferase
MAPISKLYDLPLQLAGMPAHSRQLIDASKTTMPYLKIVRVISNRSKAYGLKRAENASIPTAYHNLISGKYHSSGEKDPAVIQAARERYDADLADLVIADSPDLVVCLGWMHVFAEKFLDPLAAKNVPVINLHPVRHAFLCEKLLLIWLLQALPGRYNGKDAIKRAYDDYQEGKLENNRTGIMIHYVIRDVDMGTPIVVREIECRTPETLEQLTERVHEQEHELTVEGTAMAIVKLWEDRGKRSA